MGYLPHQQKSDYPSFIKMAAFHFDCTEQNVKIKRMGNCLSKFDDKAFTLHTPPLTSGIRKNPVKYFAPGVHQNYGYEKITQSIKSSLMDVYDRFPPQSC